jgi:hypothetical protein
MSSGLRFNQIRKGLLAAALILNTPHLSAQTNQEISHSSYNFGLEFDIPYNVFAIKGLNADKNRDDLVANASFSPQFASKLRASVGYQNFELGLGTQLGTNHNYRAIDAHFDVTENIVLGGFLRKYAGFNEQISFVTNDPNTHEVKFDGNAKTFNRSDVVFRDDSIILRLNSQTLNLSFNEQGIAFEFPLRFHVGLEYRYQALSAQGNLIVDQYQDEFGDGKKLQAFTQNTFGPSIGADAEIKFNRSSYLFGFSTGISGVVGSYRYQGSTNEEAALNIATNIKVATGYRWSGMSDEWSALFRMEGFSSNIRNLSFSSIFLAMQFNYSHRF